MFTGLVEEIGEVTAVDKHDVETGGTVLTVSLPPGSSLLSDAILGDSISVNGVCLTATSIQLAAVASASSPSSFTVQVAPETLRVTDLGSLGLGSRVNLERAVRADTRLGGHFVQGHVDCIADLLSVVPDGEALTLRMAPRRADVMRYVVRKGFIAVDGASLTVTRVDDEDGWWEVMLIAYTQERIVTAGKIAGGTVNVEVDVLAKYAEKSMLGYLGGVVTSSSGGAKDAEASFPLLEKLVERAVAKKLAGGTK